MTQPHWLTAPQPRTMITEAQYREARHPRGSEQMKRLAAAAKANGHPGEPFCYVRDAGGNLWACGGV